MFAGGILGILALLFLLGSIICWILVLIRMFKDAGALQGIIGLLCSLWAFIWGWMNSSRLGIRNIMIAWTALLVLYLILMFAAGGLTAVSGPGVPTTP